MSDMIQPAPVERWLEALRSGEYKQAQGVLKCEHGYCCLGVPAEISGVPFKESYVSQDPKRGLVYNADFGNTINVANVPGNWHHQLTNVGLAVDTLIDFNDGNTPRGVVPFSEIADYIEANYKPLENEE